MSFHHDNAAVADWLDGALLWQKPPLPRTRYPLGFTGEIAAIGSSYARSTSPGTLSLTIAGAGLEPTLTVRAVAAPANRFYVDNPAVTLMINPLSGAYSGTFRPNGAKSIPLRGVFLSRLAIGFGHVVAPDATRPVDFQPVP